MPERQRVGERPTLRWLFVRLPVDPDRRSDRDDNPLSMPINLALVAIGGVAGSLARAWVATKMPHAGAAWPWSTIVVNIIGSGLLAFLLVVLIERFPSVRTVRPLIGAGVMGGFTTFSTFALDTVHLEQAGRDGFALAYVVVTVLGALLATVFAIMAARVIDRILDRERWHRRVRHALAQESELVGR